MKPHWMSALAAVALACGPAPLREVRPDDMSAAQHHREAARERAVADDHVSRYDAAVASGAPTYGPIAPEESHVFGLPIYDPNAWHLSEAERHSLHAAEHERAARELESFEAEECRDFPASARVACPMLAPVTAVEEIAGGVRVRFGAEANVGAIVAHMRCHYAYARARAFADPMVCPLYMRGLRIVRLPGASYIELTAPDAVTAQAIRDKVREMTHPARGAVTSQRVR